MRGEETKGEEMKTVKDSPDSGEMLAMRSALISEEEWECEWGHDFAFSCK